MNVKQKDTQGLGMPWEAEYGYAQGLKQDGMVWLSGQVGHNANGTVAPDMESRCARRTTIFERC